MDEKAFSTSDGGKKNLRVHLINPPGGLKTLGEHAIEQQEARDRHQMFIQQHESLMSQNALISRSHKATVFAAVFSGIAALATCTLVYFSYQEIHIQQEMTKQALQEAKQKTQTMTSAAKN